MGKPRSTAKRWAPSGDEHDVAGVLVDFAGDEADIFDVADAADGASGTRRTMHAAGIEFDDAFFVGQAAEADGMIFRIVLAAETNVVNGFEGVSAIEEHVVGLLDGGVAGFAGDDDGLGRRLELLDGVGSLGEGVGNGGEAEAGGGDRTQREEIAAGSHGGKDTTARTGCSVQGAGSTVPDRECDGL